MQAVDKYPGQMRKISSLLSKNKYRKKAFKKKAEMVLSHMVWVKSALAGLRSTFKYHHPK